MKIVTKQEMKKIEDFCFDKLGIPSIILMENTAMAVMEVIENHFENINQKKIGIFCGIGNNGGDGFALARHLHSKEVDFQVVLLGQKEKLSKDARMNCEILEKMNIEIIIAKDEEEKVLFSISQYDIILDAILGTGITREIDGITKRFMEAINNSGKDIISIDIPSGIETDSGKVMGSCITANMTVALGFPKLGLFLYPGRNYVGDLRIQNISIPKISLDTIDIKNSLITTSYVKKLIPKRAAESNKGTYGKVFMVAGSIGMTGAAYLSTMSAYKSGAGLVYLFLPYSLVHVMDAKATEVILLPMKEKDGYIRGDNTPKILEHIKKASVVGIGPGLSQKEDILEILNAIIENADVPIVVDADGLNVLAKNKEILRKAKVPIILTPHPGEMSRLVNLSIEEVLENEVSIIKSFSKHWNVIMVLKSSKTFVCHPDGRMFVSNIGNSGMATGGSGDVLTGILTGLIAQGVNAFEAAIAAVYTHGLAGEFAKKEVGEHSMIASDIMESISKAIGCIRNS